MDEGFHIGFATVAFHNGQDLFRKLARREASTDEKSHVGLGHVNEVRHPFHFHIGSGSERSEAIIGRRGSIPCGGRSRDTPGDMNSRVVRLFEVLGRERHGGDSTSRDVIEEGVRMIVVDGKAPEDRRKLLRCVQESGRPFGTARGREQTHISVTEGRVGFHHGAVETVGIPPDASGSYVELRHHRGVRAPVRVLRRIGVGRAEGCRRRRRSRHRQQRRVRGGRREVALRELGRNR